MNSDKTVIIVAIVFIFGMTVGSFIQSFQHHPCTKHLTAEIQNHQQEIDSMVEEVKRLKGELQSEEFE